MEETKELLSILKEQLINADKATQSMQIMLSNKADNLSCSVRLMMLIVPSRRLHLWTNLNLSQSQV